MIVAITGASGIPISVKLLQKLKQLEVQTELIISKAAKKVIKAESRYSLEQIESLAEITYEEDDLEAPPSSGSHKFESMIVVPCTMKTTASIAHGFSNNLITRAADVCLKEKRKLILVVRESPLNAIHLENMLKLAKLGVIIAPPIPSFYHKPKTIEDLTEFFVGRLLDLIGRESNIRRWGDG